MKCAGQIGFSSFSKKVTGMGIREVLYNDQNVRKRLNICVKYVKPDFRHVVSKSPEKRVKKIGIHRGTSSFHSIPRSHFYSAVICN